MEGRIEYRNRWHIIKYSPEGLDSSDIGWIMKGRQLGKLFDFLYYILRDQDRVTEYLAAMHHPMPYAIYLFKGVNDAMVNELFQ